MATSTPRKPRKSRTKGRPDAVDGVGPEALLDATIEELRHTPPQVLTLAAVAQRAGVHPALLRYYFGSKDSLLTRATQRLVEGEHETVRPSVQSHAPLEDKLKSRLTGMIDLIEANPHFHRLVLDQIYGKSAHSPENELLSRVTARGLTLTVSMLHDTPNTPVRALDPRFLHVALIGLTEFFTSAEPLLRELFGPNTPPEEIKKRYIDFLTDLILNGVKNEPEQPSANPN